MRYFRDFPQVVAVILTVATLAGCASHGGVAAGTAAEGQTPVEGRVDQPAELIDCEDFGSPEPLAGERFVVVTVPLVVGPAGTVKQVGTPRARRGVRTRDVLDRAVSLARTCVFEPAELDGRRVEDRVEVRFRIAREVNGAHDT